jgi:hypothetical protein
MSQVHIRDTSVRDARRDQIRQLRREAAKDAEIRRQAALVRDQDDLDQLLDGADPAMRTALIAYLKPYLSFTPVDVAEPIEDCPTCGLRRGSAIAHACTQ